MVRMDLVLESFAGHLVKFIIMRMVKYTSFKYLMCQISCIWSNLPYFHSCNELKLNETLIILRQPFQSMHTAFASLVLKYLPFQENKYWQNIVLLVLYKSLM